MPGPLGSDSLLSWTPVEEGEYTIIVHADDGLTYDSQKVRIDVGPMEVPEISLTSYPECGGTANIQGVISGTNNYHLNFLKVLGENKNKSGSGFGVDHRITKNQK